MRLIIATRNKSKLKEIRHLLRGADIRILSLADLKRRVRIVENGKTFAENAAKKAVAVSRVYRNDYVLGEDSGLAVTFLGGLPGVYSKRYASANGDQDKNNQKILRALKGVPRSKRQASFCCHLALARGGRLIREFAGRLWGTISRRPAGEGGFGYDPVFYLPPLGKTVAQLPLEEKNKISHRAKAFKKLKKYLFITLEGGGKS
jgi:XTP/dITP diphosphohydrolase